jgi:hypothetical protein
MMKPVSVRRQTGTVQSFRSCLEALNVDRKPACDTLGVRPRMAAQHGVPE